MKEKLAKLVTQFEPEIQVIVAEVIEKEREHLDMLKPRGVKEDIQHIIDRTAQHGLDGRGRP